MLELRYQFDILVVACNTASTVVLPRLRAKLKIPVVGVVPAVKPAALLTKTLNIGILATEATVQRDYTKGLIETYAEGVQVTLLGSNRLVEICEEKVCHEIIDYDELRTILQPMLKNTSIDVLVLACTHFPWLREEIQHIFGSGVKIIHSGAAIANRVSYLLEESPSKNRNSKENSKSNIYFCSTGRSKSYQTQLDFLYPNENIEIFELN